MPKYSKNITETLPEEEVTPAMKEVPVIIHNETEIIAEKATPVIEAQELVHPADLITLRVYATLSGRKLDQMAGFINYANRNKLGPMTVQSWNSIYTAFQGTPVK
jgi:hypothetical protein